MRRKSIAGIRNLDSIGLWTPRNVGRDERLKVVTRLPARDGNHIGADTVLVIGIARRVIDALVVRAGSDVGEGSSKDIVVVGDAIGVGINRARRRSASLAPEAPSYRSTGRCERSDAEVAPLAIRTAPTAISVNASIASTTMKMRARFFSHPFPSLHPSPLCGGTQGPYASFDARPSPPASIFVRTNRYHYRREWILPRHAG